ncbi:MAG: glycosyltransferase [Rhodospirillaceae bacterium]
MAIITKGLPRVSVVTLHWNAGDVTLAALRNILDWDYPQELLDVVVHDNASFDGSSEPLAAEVAVLAGRGLAVSYVRSAQHPGPTQAFNRAVALTRSDARYILRFDNDGWLDSNALSILVRYLEDHADVGSVGARVVIAGHPELHNGAAIWFTALGNTRIEHHERPVVCDTFLPAALLVRREIVSGLGRMFDPELYLFYEEPEFHWQITKLGFNNVWHPDAIAYNHAGTSTGKTPDLCLYLNARNSAIVLTQILPWPMAQLRNLIQFVRLLGRWFIMAESVRLRGCVDGMLRRPLNHEWWNQNMQSNGIFIPLQSQVAKCPEKLNKNESCT